MAVTTEITASEQLILFHNRELNEIIEGTLEIHSWPKNILRGQLYLYQREKLDQQRLVLPEIRKTVNTVSDTPLFHRNYVEISCG